MTLKEKVAELEPEKICDDEDLGAEGCPLDYSYLNVMNERDCPLDDSGLPMDCKECWDREYVPPKTKEISNPPVPVNLIEFVKTMGSMCEKHHCRNCPSSKIELCLFDPTVLVNEPEEVIKVVCKEMIKQRKKAEGKTYEE